MYWFYIFFYAVFKAVLKTELLYRLRGKFKFEQSKLNNLTFLLISKPLKTVKNIKKYKKFISTQNFKKNLKIIVKITITIKKVIENIKSVKNTCLLKILRRI